MGRALVEDDDLKDFYRVLKASSLRQASASEKDPEKQEKLYRKERRLRSKLNREDALSDLFELFDAEMMQRMEEQRKRGCLDVKSKWTPEYIGFVPSVPKSSMIFTIC